MNDLIASGAGGGDAAALSLSWRITLRFHKLVSRIKPVCLLQLARCWGSRQRVSPHFVVRQGPSQQGQWSPLLAPFLQMAI